MNYYTHIITTIIRHVGGVYTICPGLIYTSYESYYVYRLLKRNQIGSVDETAFESLTSLKIL